MKNLGAIITLLCAGLAVAVVGALAGKRAANPLSRHSNRGLSRAFADRFTAL